MRTLSRIQSLVNGSAIIRAAIADGSVQVLYRQPPAISDDRLTVTWRLSLLVLDPALQDVLINALKRQGFSVKEDGGMLQAVQDFLMTAQDRAEMAAEDAEEDRRTQIEENQARQQQTAITISELQEQIQALRDELEMMRLLPSKGGRKGEKGDPGDPGARGRDGQDLLATSARLVDLQDVSEEEAEQGQVLTWDQISQMWEPKSPRVALASIGGGAVGGSGLLGLTVGTYGVNGEDISTEVTALRFDAGAGFSVVQGPDGVTEARVSLNSTFKTWKIDGQQDVVAEGEDTMHLVAGTGVVLTTSPTFPKSITISASGSGAGLEHWEESATGHLRPLTDGDKALGDEDHAIQNIYLGGGLLGVDQDGRLLWNGLRVGMANEQSPLADGGAVTVSGTPDPVELDASIPGIEADGGSLS